MASCPLRRTKKSRPRRARAPPRGPPPARPGSERRVRTATRSLRFVGSRAYVFSLNRTGPGRLDGHEGKYLGLISAATTRGGGPARPALGACPAAGCATLACPTCGSRVYCYRRDLYSYPYLKLGPTIMPTINHSLACALTLALHVRSRYRTLLYRADGSNPSLWITSELGSASLCLTIGNSRPSRAFKHHQACAASQECKW